MLAYILKRLLLMIPTLFGVMLITFVVTQFVPGGPVEQLIHQFKGQGPGGEASSGDDAVLPRRSRDGYGAYRETQGAVWFRQAGA